MSEQILNPVTPLVSGAVVASGNAIPVWVVSGGTSGSIGFPIASGQVGSVLAGGTIEVASGGFLQIDSGGSQTILNGGAIGVSSGGLITVSPGASVVVRSNTSTTFLPNATVNLFGATETISGGTGQLLVVGGASLQVSNGASLNISGGATLVVSGGATIGAVTANTLNAALTNDPNTMPYQTGNWYFGPMGAADSTSTTNFSSNTMLAIPFFVSQPGTVFTSMGYFQTSQALTVSVIMGVYRANSTGSTTVPTGASLVAGTGSSGVSIASNTSGLATVDISGATFSIGWHWLVLVSNQQIFGYRTSTGNTESVWQTMVRRGQSTFASATPVSGSYFLTSNFGSMPTTFPTSALVQLSASTTPAIGVKAA